MDDHHANHQEVCLIGRLSDAGMTSSEMLHRMGFIHNPGMSVFYLQLLLVR